MDRVRVEGRGCNEKIRRDMYEGKNDGGFLGRSN